MSYGLQQVIESSDTYLADNQSLHMNTANGFNFLDYYYQSAYVLKPALQSMHELMSQVIDLRYDKWQSTFLGIIGGLAIYLVIYVTVMISSMAYLKKRQGHYSVFYTIVPKEMRERNNALREYVTQLIKVTD